MTRDPDWEARKGKCADGADAALLEAAFEQSYTGKCVAGADGRLRRVNRAFCRMTGRSPEELCGMELLMLIAPEAREAYRDLVTQLYEGQASAETGDFRLKTADGGVIEVAMSVVNLDSMDGADRLLYVDVLDETAHCRARDALRETTEKLRVTIDEAPVSLAMVSLERRFLGCNRAFCEFLGYSEEEIIGKFITDITYGPDREIGDEETIAVARGQRPRARVEKRYVRKDGGIVWGDVSINLLRNADGSPLYFLPIILDITERRRIEEERASLVGRLNQAQRLESVGRLAGGVAHDFNNMLGAIMGNVELALADGLLPPSLVEHLMAVKEVAHRSSDLTRQLLAFASRQPIAPRPLDLNETIEGLLGMVHRLIGEDISLIYNPARELGSIRMDPSQVDQILVNLCVNARDALNGGGELRIETCARTVQGVLVGAVGMPGTGDYICLTVQDTGRGMDEATRARIFDPFFTTKELGRGTGLGLATVYGSVKQNGGFITVHSEPGQGSTFTLYFPRYQEHVEPQAKALAVKETRGRGEKILLVEDEPILLKVGVRMLERLGYKVIAVSSPEAALARVREGSETIDLVVTDLVMPGMSGSELARRMQQQFPGIGVLFISGYSAGVMESGGLLEEGACFLQKPFTVRDLAARVHEALGGDCGSP